jgi:hypothetical protein
MTSETSKFSYQSRLIYETVLSDALKRCLKERVDNPNTMYHRSVKAFSMAMPSRIKKDFMQWQKEKNVFDTVMDENDAVLVYLLERMEKNNLLIPQKSIPRGGGYR